MPRFQGMVIGILLLSGAAAQQKEKSGPQGAIHGIAISQDGQPAKRIGLTAEPLGVAVGAVLPHARTNDAGEYRFESVPWWGRYTVYAEDEEAGYSRFSTGPAGDSNLIEVEVTPEHRRRRTERCPSPESRFHSHPTHESKNWPQHL